MSHRIIEIRPHAAGWKVYEAPGVQPWWSGDNARQSAISYAKERARFGTCEIRVKDAEGKTVETIRPERSRHAAAPI